MQATQTIGLSTQQRTAENGIGKRFLSWLDFFGAVLTVSKAWSAHRRVDARTLARAGMTDEMQERLMKVHY
jgi:hypothetical protein